MIILPINYNFLSIYELDLIRRHNFFYELAKLMLHMFKCNNHKDANTSMNKYEFRIKPPTN